MRQPNEYWLIYMILSPGIGVAAISDMAEMYGVEPPHKGYLKELTLRLAKTKPKPFKATSTKVRNWLRRQRVWSLWSEDEDAVAARSILGDHKIRRVLQILIMADTERAKIPEYCLRIAGSKPSLKTVKLFEHYFWNRDLLSIADWEEHLQGSYDRDLLVDSHQMGPEYALWKLGYREEMTNEEIIRGVLHESTMRFFETSSKHNNKDTAMTAKMWSEIQFKALAELDKTGDAVQQVLDQLKSIAIVLKDTGAKDINELTGGRHSNSEEE